MGMPGVGLPGGPQAGLPQKTSIKELNETIADLEALQKDWKAVSELKDMFQCSKKVEDALVTLKNAQAHLHNQDEVGKAIAERSEFRSLVLEA